ncbi:MAG: HigA family addiction module antidote protein [Alphaproteobacteria bacterium]|jgi:addiction module HigA family antidote|nr:HigA family addiction module antidote protein [Alphaproteobacteria bacterium]
MTAQMTARPAAPETISKSLAVPEADAATVRRWLDAGEILLVDVRETAEYEQEHIPGAVLCPLSVFDSEVFPKIPEKMVVLHCAIGKRSAAAAKQLIETGHTRIINLAGGIKAWKETGGPTETQIVIPDVPQKLPLLKKDGPCGPDGLMAALPESSTPRPVGIHPGKILLEEFLTPLGISQGALARELKVSVSRINAIVSGRASVSADTSLRLSRFFCTTDEFWLHLQAAHDLEKARNVEGARIKKDIRIRRAAA